MSLLSSKILGAAMAQSGNAQALTNLGISLCDQGKDAEAAVHFEKALAVDANFRPAHHGLALLALRAGDFDRAAFHNPQGYRGVVPANADVVVIESAFGGNVPTAPFIAEKTLVVAELCDAPLPPHKLVFNAVGDADRTGGVLPIVENILAQTTAPVIDPPSAVRGTGRAELAARLSSVSGIVLPRVALGTREILASMNAPAVLAQNGFSFPLLLRAAGFHTGEHFEKIENTEALAPALANLPGDPVFVLQFLDTRNADGHFRKYRALFLGAEIVPLHLAVSARWKVHYFSADMTDSPAFRVEDEAFLNDMPRAIGERAFAQLQAIRDALALDYGGIDFALDDAGNIIVFEANATMVIVDPPDDARFAYRRAPVERARAAAQKMIADTIARGARA